MFFRAHEQEVDQAMRMLGTQHSRIEQQLKGMGVAPVVLDDASGPTPESEAEKAAHIERTLELVAKVTSLFHTVQGLPAPREHVCGKVKAERDVVHLLQTMASGLGTSLVELGSTLRDREEELQRVRAELDAAHETMRRSQERAQTAMSELARLQRQESKNARIVQRRS